MRRLRVLALVGLLMSLGLPATAAPSVTTEVILTGDAPTGVVDVILNADPGAGTASINAAFATDSLAFCGGAFATVHVVWQASSTVATDTDRQFRSGTFGGPVMWDPEVVGGCGDYFQPMPGQISGTFETSAQADRWREGTTRFVERSGFGMVELGILETLSLTVDVNVVRVFSH